MRPSLPRIGIITFALLAALWLVTAKSSWAVTLYQRDGHVFLLHSWEGLIRAVYGYSHHDGDFVYELKNHFDGDSVHFECLEHSRHTSVVAFSSSSEIAARGKNNSERLVPTRYTPGPGCTVSGWAMRVPIWPMLVVSAIFVASPLAIRAKRRARAKRGECPACGYDLTGNTTGVCPECGGGDP